MAKIYKSVEELIGNTPLLELTKIEKETGATLLAKVEALNPGGSAKDRIAKRMVEDAEKAGGARPAGYAGRAVCAGHRHRGALPPDEPRRPLHLRTVWRWCRCGSV